MSTAIPTPKRLAILALFVFFVWGHINDVVSGREHWPFSNYPMYSNLYHSRTLRTVRVVWVTDEAQPRELSVGGTYSRTRFEWLVQHTRNRQQRQRLVNIMRSTLNAEHARRAEEAVQPQVRGLRVYQLVYYMTPRLKGRPAPDRKTLVAQVGWRPPGTGSATRPPAGKTTGAATTRAGSASPTTAPAGSVPTAPPALSSPSSVNSSPSARSR